MAVLVLQSLGLGMPTSQIKIIVNPCPVIEKSMSNPILRALKNKLNRYKYSLPEYSGSFCSQPNFYNDKIKRISRMHMVVSGN